MTLAPIDLSANKLNAAAGSSAIAANTDIEAVRTWLQVRGCRSQNTLEAYRKEAIRLLTWIHERNLAFNEMKVEHVHQYFAFLAAPPPHWLKPKKVAKHTVLKPTQLLTGPLSMTSIAYARRVLGQLFGYLQDAGYLSRNPFKLSSSIPVPVQDEIERFLDLETWRWFWEWLCTRTATTQRSTFKLDRARWIFALLYHTGIRLQEIAKGNMADFGKSEIHGLGETWRLRVCGKRNKVRWVSVNSSLLSELIRYRKSLSMLTPLPSPSDIYPLVASINDARASKALCRRSIGLIVHDVFKLAINDCQDERIANNLSLASTHWLRHTNATHRIMAGADLITTQDELGHANINTTRIYAKSVDKKRFLDAEKLAEMNSL